MFAGTALSIHLLVYAGLSLFIISGPYLYMVVCVLYVYNLTMFLQVSVILFTEGVLSQHALQVVTQHALQVSRPTPKGKFRGIWSRPTPKGEVEGDLARGGTCSWLGACSRGAPMMATVTGSTHPTGMHSCFIMFAAFEN